MFLKTLPAETNQLTTLLIRNKHHYPGVKRTDSVSSNSLTIPKKLKLTKRMEMTAQGSPNSKVSIGNSIQAI